MTTIPTYFDTPEKVAALRAEAERWVDTPFFDNSEARGRDGGVDCVHLLHALNVALGVIEPVSIPRQVMDWGDHSERSLLIEAFETWPTLRTRFARVFDAKQTPDLDPVPLLVPGDVLAINGGKVPHHGAQLLDRLEIVHCLRPTGVFIMGLRVQLRGWQVLGRIAAIYRPLPLP